MNHRASAVLLVLLAISLMTTIVLLLQRQHASLQEYAAYRSRVLQEQAALKVLKRYAFACLDLHEITQPLSLQLLQLIGSSTIEFLPKEEAVEILIFLNRSSGPIYFTYRKGNKADQGML